MMDETFLYQGHEIPVDLLRMTGGGPESFGVISDAHISILQNRIGIEPKHSVLEIGCGIGRDAIPLTSILSPGGHYVGIDIIKRSIDWCTSSVTTKNPNFKFFHFDIQDQLHNPNGSSDITDYTLPFEDQSVDRIILWSVFTHMFSDDVIYYMKEFSRVLKPSGLVWATFFIVDDGILESARKTNLTIFDLRFEHPYGPGCFVNDLAYPAGAVAYLEDRLTKMISASQLELARPLIHGSWSGHFPAEANDPGQDAVILRRKG